MWIDHRTSPYQVETIKATPTGIENYKYLQQIWKQKEMRSFKDFLCWYYNNDGLPTLEAMHKMITFHHDKDIDMLKRGCTWPNLANICLSKSTHSKFCPFREGDKCLLTKNWDVINGGSPFIFTRTTVVDETFFRKTMNFCKSFVGIDASQK